MNKLSVALGFFITLSSGRAEPPACWTPKIFGAAQMANLFVTDSIQAYCSDIEGRLLVGGRAQFINYSIGGKIQVNVLANGKLEAADGYPACSVSFGDRFQLEHGSIFNGNMCTSGVTASPFWVDGYSTVADTETLPFDIQEQLSSLSYASHAGWKATDPAVWNKVVKLVNGQQESEQQVLERLVTKLEPAVDFLQVTRDLKSYSKYLMGLKPNGNVKIDRALKVWDLKGSDGLLNVFELAMDQFQALADQPDTSGEIRIDAPANSVVVVNFTGCEALADNCGTAFKHISFILSGGITANRVLYNFYQVERLSFAYGTGVNGVILAPWATLQFEEIHVNGQVFVEKFIGGKQNCSVAAGEYHQVPFVGRIPVATCSDPVTLSYFK